MIEESAEYIESINLAKSWGKLLNDNHPNINCVIPPSIAGLHISLGKYSKNDKNKPKCLIQGKKVSFKITEIKTMKTVREIPENICGQSIDNNGLRYYPCLWILAEILFLNDFKFETKYPPHISLAALAVQLNVDKVEQLKGNIKINHDEEKEK